jgi:hypothetical protein
MRTSRHLVPVATVATVLACALVALGCNRLPETVPYEAIVRERKAANQDYRIGDRIGELAGGDLKLDGKTVGQLADRGAKVILNAQWSGPKAGFRAQLDGKYTVTTTGPCGTFDLPLEGPPPNWKAMDESGAAKALKSSGRFSVFLDALMPPAHEIYVDWENSAGTLTIGTVKLEAGKKSNHLSFGGCKGPLAVMFNGKSLGDLDLTARGTLITLEPNVCHVFQQVGYGDRAANRPSVKFPAKPVVSVSEYPDYALEFGPSTINLSSKGTTITELVRSRCR